MIHIYKIRKQKVKYLFVYIILLFNYALTAQLSAQNPQFDIVDILHYKFDLKLNDSTDFLEAKAEIKVRFLKKPDHFYLDLTSKKGDKGMEVLNANCGKQRLKYTHVDNKLLIFNEKWKNGDTATIDISYRGIPVDGLIISKNKYGDRTFFGDNWPDRAHNWLPVIDHPSDKATVEFILEVPEHYEVIASGILKQKTNVSPDVERYQFISDIPLPTKVMVIGVADFNFRNYGEVDSIPVSSMIFASSPVCGLDDYKASIEALKFYVDLIGEYPFEKLVNVQSNTIYGGMENAGNIFYSENSIDGKANNEDLIAHEIAHQWFGDAVTEKDWHHVWLSEGFATYLTSVYLEHKYGEEAFKNRMMAERETVIYYNSYKPGSIIDQGITDWNMLLNPNTYQKAAWVLHMLRKKTGDKDFFRILSTFYNDFKNKNAESTDFIRIVNEITKSDFSGFFDQWLYKKGIPDLYIRWTIENNILFIETSQKGDIFNIDLPIKLEDYSNNEDLILKIRNKAECYAFPLTAKLDTEKTKLEIDPEVTQLQRNYVDRIYSKPDKIPLIEGAGLLKEGDLLFQDLDCGPLCDAIESVTEGYRGAHFSHVGIVVADKNGKLKIAEAIDEKVGVVEPQKFFSRYSDILGRPKVVVGRLKEKILADNALEKIEKYLGKTYDDVFDIDDDKYYCSELVYFVYTDKNGKNLFQLNPMTFKERQTGKFFPPWKKYFEKLNKPIPEGKPGINPGGISKSDKLDIIYRYGDPEGW